MCRKMLIEVTHCSSKILFSISSSFDFIVDLTFAFIENFNIVFPFFISNCALDSFRIFFRFYSHSIYFTPTLILILFL